MHILYTSNNQICVKLDEENPLALIIYTFFNNSPSSLKEGGQTALGPALVLSILIASRATESKVIMHEHAALIVISLFVDYLFDDCIDDGIQLYAV